MTEHQQLPHLTVLQKMWFIFLIFAVMRLWFEIIGLSMRGQEPYQKTVALLLERSEERIRAKLRADQKHRAREVLARLEGELMLALLMPV